MSAPPKRSRLRFEPGAAVRIAGLMAAMFIAVVLNALGARHYKRWDWTKGQRYTLTSATVETLHGLTDPVQVWVILGGGDPLLMSVKQLLTSYEAETTHLDVQFIDPDRDTLALVDLQRKFHIEAGKTDDGRVTTDAILVVAHKGQDADGKEDEQRSFLTAEDMFEVIASSQDPRAKPREEQAITGAIRTVTRRGSKVRVCFTTGHGEISADPSSEWIGDLRTVLERDMYTLSSVDTAAPNAFEPFKACDVAVIARPQAPFSKEEETRLKTYLMQGGNALVAAGPVNADTASGMTPLGLEDALAPFGIAPEEDLVHELDPELSIADSRGEAFIATPKPHAVSQALVPQTPASHPPKVGVLIARSLKHVSPDGAAAASDVLVTSDQAYGVRSIKGAMGWNDAPPKQAGDISGPMVIAMASERPKTQPAAAHGPRLVVIGSGYALLDKSWRAPRSLRGMGFLVENAISWLSARPAVLDVPERPTVAAGIRITDDSRDHIRNYVLIYMPLAAALLGIAVALRRRSTEGK